MQSTRGVHTNKLESHETASHKASVFIAAELPRLAETKRERELLPQATVGQTAGCYISLNKYMFTMLLGKQTNRKARHKSEDEVF